MNAAHVHLILNHIPVLGTPFALILLAYGFARRSDDVQRAALGAFVVVGLFCIPVYFSGLGAENNVMGLPGIVDDVIDQHHDSARWALLFSLVLGAAALVGLILFRGTRPIPAWYNIAILVLALFVTIVMARTANLGGRIHHPEAHPYGALTRPASRINRVISC